MSYVEARGRSFGGALLHIRKLVVYALAVPNAHDLDAHFVVDDAREDAVASHTIAPPVIGALQALDALDLLGVIGNLEHCPDPFENHEALLLRDAQQLLRGAVGPLDPIAHSAIMAMRMTSSVV